ncbi:thioester reductase domain-containing protein [Enhygromyxa salina]|uniref:thioester reductase domain-containing protein n=1 Tax=Enhygromyxa salina TaxID=215803 RepID=UPI0004E79077|nr:thioester reductase domain-containing protein [Enhygromyxa salina]
MSHPSEGYSFLLGADADGPRAQLSYAQLYARARTVAAMLDAAGARGERVMLVFGPGLEFIVGLFACLLSGAVAVPVYPPNPSRLYKTLPLLEAIATDAQARFGLTSADLMEMTRAVAQLSEGLAKLEWLSTSDAGGASDWTASTLEPSQLAFLQYTSGSTGEPKGVMLSHANLLHNEAMIQAGFAQRSRQRVVGWLPLYHDMGLIGNVINPMWVGGSALLLSPISFLKRPMLWLEAISSFRGRTSGGPNFAYDLCVDRLAVDRVETAELENLDLSCWEVAFNGAEPVRAATMRRFAKAFAPAGLDARALFPCYGLAESTLAVTAVSVGTGPNVLHANRAALERGRAETSNADPGPTPGPTPGPAGGPNPADWVELVSSGRPLPGSEVAIVDPELLCVLDDAVVGEICVRGSHVAGGYWGRPVLSRAIFGLELVGDPSGPWLRTGDLGFMRDGELFVCGRRKDLLIVRGRNLHPHDLERAIGDAHAQVRPGCVVAFATEHDGLEEVVIIVEVRDGTPSDRYQAILSTAREVLADGFGVRPLDVLLVTPHTLPKTSSGKLRRSAAREAWLAGRLEPLAHSDGQDLAAQASQTSGPGKADQSDPPRDIVEARVLDICAEVLGHPGLTRTDDFFKLGADSVAIASMTAKLEVMLGREVTLGAVFDAPSVAGLAVWLREEGYDTTQLRARELPLTPDMHRLLRVASGAGGLPADTLYLAAAFSLRVGGTDGMDSWAETWGAGRSKSEADVVAALEVGLQAFAARHAALRTSFVLDSLDQPNVMCQRIAANVEITLEREPLAGLDEFEAVYAEQVRRPIPLDQAPLWRFVLLEHPGAEPVLCVVAHHLVSDHASFRVLVNELEADLHGDARVPGPPDDGALTRLATLELGDPGDALEAESFAGIEPLSFVNFTGRSPDAGYAAKSVFVELDPAIHAGVDALARSLGVLPAALGFAVLQLLLHRVCGVERFVVGVPVDQRIALGSPDAVGYFGVPVPIACRVNASDTPRVLARRSQGQLRRAMDSPGLPVSLSASLERALGCVPGVPLLQVLFNVLPANEHARGASLRRLPIGPVSMDIDLSLSLVRGPQGGAIELHHRADVLDREGSRQFVEAYVELLSTLARDVDTPLSHHAWPTCCPAAPTRRRIALAATFTAEPMIPIIVGWGRLFEIPFEVEPEPYAQVIQPLLDPASALRSEDVVARVLLVRLVDVFRARDVPPGLDDYRDWCADLLDAVREAASAGLMIIGLPPSDASEDLLELERELGEGLAAISGVRVLGPQAMLAALRVDALFDTQADALAHVPFTSPAYAAFATAIVRELWRHDRQLLKLVAVDADNTLWSGVVGEDGPAGLDPAPFASLHQRLRECRAAGVLLAIVSNNDPDLVRAALERPELPNAEDFIAIEGGWDSKAARLINLAERLSLGVDSFCFLDDNEVEVAAMRDACPEALAFVLPKRQLAVASKDAAGSGAGFVERLWALDVDARTQADLERPRRYAEERARRSSRRAGQGHLEFVRSLELSVVARPVERHLERAAQLSARTNQFNLRKRPRTADELASEIGQPDVRATVIEVHDRFGDYGIVGLVVARLRHVELVVETLLLSCRVLGRGVELELLKWLAEQADELGAATVRFLAEPSPRNTPARRFVRRVGDAGAGELVEGIGGGLELRIATAGLRTIGLSALLERVEHAAGDSTSRRLDIDRRLEAKRLGWIASELVSGEDVLRAFGIRWLQPGVGSASSQSEAGSALAREIAARMAALLHLGQFDVDADFLAAGASSLTAVELLADLRRELGLGLTLDDLVIAPSARALASVAAGTLDAGQPAREVPLPERMATDAQLDPTIFPAGAGTAGATWTGTADRAGIGAGFAAGYAARSGSTTALRRVLLTGVTGFVGAHLLFELLRQTDATVVCLIRARDAEHAWERLRAAIERVELPWSMALRRRVEVQPGDLTAARLGLGGDSWRREAEELDAIYHCGAAVNFAQPYELQRGPNIEGTRSLIELACAQRPTAFHYVSTIGVLVGAGCLARDMLDEDTLPGPGAALPIGYQQSKWVAERLVLEAGARGLPVVVYRPGTIGPHSTTGCHNPDDLFMLLLRASDRLRCLPDIRDVDIAPVDWIVSMIVGVSVAGTGSGSGYGPGSGLGDTRGRILHLVNPAPVSIAQMHEWYELSGSGMRIRDFEGWLDAVRADLGDDPNHPLSALRAILGSETGREFCRLVNLAPRTDARRATQLATQLELPCPPLDAAQMIRWDRKLRAAGLLEDRLDEAGVPARYMWFREHLVGGGTGPDGARTTLELDFLASVTSLRQLLDDRRIDVSGRVLCPALHPAPLHVREGHWWVRPNSGLGRASSSEATLMRIRVELVDEDGRELWLEGHKVARPRFDLWRQSRTFELELGDASGSLISGQAEVEGKTWVEDQVYSVDFHPDVPEAERRRARLLYLAWLGGNIGRTFYDLALRLGISVVSGK